MATNVKNNLPRYIHIKWNQNANNLLCQRTKVEVKEYESFLRIYRDSRDWTHVISTPLSFNH